MQYTQQHTLLGKQSPQKNKKAHNVVNWSIDLRRTYETSGTTQDSQAANLEEFSKDTDDTIPCASHKVRGPKMWV